MWDLPGPGLEPVSPALAGRFLTTAPPGKSGKISFFKEQYPEDNTAIPMEYSVTKGKGHFVKLQENDLFVEKNILHNTKKIKLK